jgi:peptide/nickel transport system substrate-binding protein
MDKTTWVDDKVVAWMKQHAIAAQIDVDAQKEAISQLALIYNELLPGVPLWERYGNNPVPSRFAAGWLPDEDPIYLNNPYADSFVVIQILDGTLGPAGQ